MRCESRFYAAAFRTIVVEVDVGKLVEQEGNVGQTHLSVSRMPNELVGVGMTLAVGGAAPYHHRYLEDVSQGCGVLYIGEASAKEMFLAIVYEFAVVAQVDNDGIGLSEQVEDGPERIVVVERGIVVVGHLLALLHAQFVAMDIVGTEAGKLLRKTL